MKPLIQQISRFKNSDCIRLPQILQLFDRLGTDQQELNLASVEPLQKRSLLCNLGCQMARLCRIDDDFTEDTDAVCGLYQKIDLGGHSSGDLEADAAVFGIPEPVFGIFIIRDIQRIRHLRGD